MLRDDPINCTAVSCWVTLAEPQYVGIPTTNKVVRCHAPAGLEEHWSRLGLSAWATEDEKRGNGLARPNYLKSLLLAES